MVKLSLQFAKNILPAVIYRQSLIFDGLVVMVGSDPIVDLGLGCLELQGLSLVFQLLFNNIINNLEINFTEL